MAANSDTDTFTSFITSVTSTSISTGAAKSSATASSRRMQPRYSELHARLSDESGRGGGDGVEGMKGANGVNGIGLGVGNGNGNSEKAEPTMRLRREGRHGDAVARLAALTFTSISAVYTTYLIASSNPRSLSWFAYHPPLQMASIALFTLGILTLQPTSQPKTKAAGLVRHQLCMLLAGAPLLAAGTWVIYHNKEINARKHFTTWHGTIGIITVSWLAVQTVVGCASVWFGGAAFGGGMKAKSVWKYHRASGYILYPLLMYAAHLGGAWSTFSNSHAGHLMRLIAYSIGPIITVIAVYSRIRPSKMKFF